MKVQDTLQLSEGDRVKTFFGRLYGENIVALSMARCQDVVRKFEKEFGDGKVLLLSSSGRTEISENRTDHNYGEVLARNTNLDCVGVAAKNQSDEMNIISKALNQRFIVDLNYLEPSEKRVGTLDLVRELLKGFLESGYEIGRLDAYVTSNVISTVGVSSSATFEMLLCFMLNIFFSEGRIDTMAYAHIGKLVENKYWSKASRLLDQMICTVGGLITIDFFELQAPVVEKIASDFSSQNYNLVIVNTGRGYADLSADYSPVPYEMKKIAEYFGREFCSEIMGQDMIDNLVKVREYVKDHSVMRAPHLFEENKRVETEVAALKEGRFEDFLSNITTSGSSSWKWLQDCYTIGDMQEQGVSIALALTELFIADKQKGTCRAHGSSFAGIIMATLPNELVDEYVTYIEKALDEGNACRMSIRPYGAICVNEVMGQEEGKVKIEESLDSKE